MALIGYTITVVAKRDNPYNVLPETDISIRKNSDNTLANIYADEAGLTPIAQLGAKTDSNGQFTFYADASLGVLKAVWTNGGVIATEVLDQNDHSKLANRNAVGAHDASAISTSSGGTVQSFVDSIESKTTKNPSSTLFNDSDNINSTDNPVALLKNRSGSNQDNIVMLFGDSHGWGQGATDQDRFQVSSNWSRWSASVFNQGFMERIAENIRRRKKWSVNKYGAGMSVAQTYLSAANNQLVGTGDPEKSLPLVCLGGNITSMIGDYVATSNTATQWYSPQTVGDSYSNLNYREKVSAGIFGPQYLRLKRCDALDMPTTGKKHFWEITPNWNAVTFGAGFTDLTYSNGGSATPVVMGAKSTTTNTVWVNSGSPVPPWVKVGAKVYIPGFGYGSVAAIGGINNSVRVTTTSGGVAGEPLAKQLHLGMKIYPAVYAHGLLMAEMQNPARVSYVAIKRQSSGGKIRLAFTSNMNGGFESFPFVDNNSTFRNSANSWAWKLASGVPSVQRVGNDGALATVPEATADAYGCVIDTANATTEDVVYRIDWGSRQQGRMFVYLDDSIANDFVDIRGIIFDNNKVTNHSMGAHTIGAMIGTQDTTSGDGIRDRVADILKYTTVRPSNVITQIPFVNEYLLQTPIATFKANLQLFVDKFNSHLAGTNNYNVVGTDFMFFTSLRNREVGFGGAASSAITYDMYTQAAKEFCDLNGHAFVDCEKELFRLVESGRVDFQRLFNDSNHPSDYANEVIARVLEQDYLQFMV